MGPRLRGDDKIVGGDDKIVGGDDKIVGGDDKKKNRVSEMESSKTQAKITCAILCISFSTLCLADTLIIEPDAGQTPLLNAIHHAESSIDVAMYGFTDKTFMKALAAESASGKKIRILLQRMPYKASHENDSAIHFFEKTPISLKWPDDTFRYFHQKTFLFDRSRAFVMTFNLTHSSFFTERNFALEITDPALVNEIQNVFDADRAHHAVSVRQSRLIWSPDNSRIKLSKIIQNAKTHILVETESLSDDNIIGLLAKAAEKHISVDVLLSSQPREGIIHYLTKAGVVIHQSHHYIIHAKIMIIDNAQAVIGSINLTKPSLDDNRELSVITTDKKVIDALAETFQKDWVTSS